MPRLYFQTEDDEHAVSSRGVEVTYTGVMSLDYKWEIDVLTTQERVQSLLSRGAKVRVSIGETSGKIIVADGILVSTSIKTMGDEKLVKIVLESSTFNALKNQSYNGILIGEFTREINRVLALDSFSMHRSYIGNISLNRYVNGFIRDIIRDISSDNSLAWNVSDDEIYSGVLLSRRYYEIEKGSMRISDGYFRNKSGDIVRKHDVTFNYRPEIMPGDRINVSKYVYIVGAVTHKYANLQSTTKKFTTLTLFQDIGDIVDFVEFMDDETRINDISKLNNTKVRYCTHCCGLVYFNVMHNMWLGNKQKVIFSIVNAGPLQEYLFLGNVQTTDVLGLYVPCDILITDVSCCIDAFDIGNVELLRNGSVIYTHPITGHLCYHDRTSIVFNKDGIMSARFQPGAGPAGTSDIIYTVHYRMVSNYE